MPRLPPSLFRRAHKISPHLPALLPTCRDLVSAQNELRWIREHACKTPPQPHKGARENEEALVAKLCRARGSGVPLQYLLGTQPFGALEIKCRRGVLIPRPETEAWASRLADVVRADAGVDARGAKVLDLCSGSGCVALLLYSLLRRSFPGLSVRGFDVEPKAVGLARENLVYNTRLGLLEGAEGRVGFGEADIFADGWLEELLSADDKETAEGMKRGAGPVDVLVSNPPYISAEGFNRDTARSVRNYEPKLALVPPLLKDRMSTPDGRPEDIFYVRLLGLVEVLRPRFTVLEVGDLKQALEVVEMAISRLDGVKVEIWRDWPDVTPGINEPASERVRGVEVPYRGSGSGRAVFIRLYNSVE
ncbi:S-adenosyl-L-methionine-dependent methyltransferase [Jackrogersella minutella]|nr:S-adenosyl-L-methionine-dependent methyltransferase [Jackrogersella minutella]